MNIIIFIISKLAKKDRINGFCMINFHFYEYSMFLEELLSNSKSQGLTFPPGDLWAWQFSQFSHS